ncbi:MAG TPA: ABC transporter ATP-binding protein [Stellaceae bacterium]|nr:ABC transporter ATP-binding protein [Stellaceae bacterium]
MTLLDSKQGNSHDPRRKMEQNVNRGDAIIKVEGVSQAFGAEGDPRRVVALESATLDIARGELLCLIGPSGCGKSTLLNIIGGLATPSTGRVTIDGHEVNGPSPQKVAYVFQENTLFPWRTVIDNVKLGMAFQGVSKSERDGRARRSLEAVGLTQFAQHYPAQLSGGMKQRVQLARALALETEVLLMDEPFAALDEQTRMVLGEDLSVLLARTGKTIIFVTHSLVEAVFLADRVAVLTARPGRIKKIIHVEEAHPRKSEFMTSEKLANLRNELYELLHDEIRKTMTHQPAEAGA